MNKNEALKQALKALEKFHYAMIDAGVLDRQEVLNEGFTAATVIKEALAQPEQEYYAVNAVHKGKQCYVKAQPESDTVQRLSAIIRAQQITIDKLEAQQEREPQRKPPQFPAAIRKMWSGTEVQEWINENWNKE